MVKLPIRAVSVRGLLVGGLRGSTNAGKSAETGHISSCQCVMCFRSLRVGSCGANVKPHDGIVGCVDLTSHLSIPKWVK